MTDIAALIANYWKAQDPYDPERIGELRHPDWHADWPQTGERIPSHEADTLIHTHYPGYPRHEVREIMGHGSEWLTTRSFLPGQEAHTIRVSGGGDTWFAEARLTYPDNVWHAVYTGQILGGLVAEETVWWGPRLDAPEWRSAWVEPLEWTSHLDVEDTFGSPSEQRMCEEAIRRYFADLHSDPSRAHEELFLEEAVEELPQSGEKITGRDHMLSVFLANPSRPQTRVTDVSVVGKVGLVVVEATEAGNQFLAVGLAHFEGTKVSRITEYWAPILEAPSWRSQWVVPLD